jgi:hypothetical protein
MQSGPDDYDPQVDDLMNRGEPTVDAAQVFAELLTQYSREFDEMCEERYKAGAERYGPGKFLMVDTFEEALQEIADLVNYARFTFIKLRLLQEAISDAAKETGALGTDGFMRARDATSVRETR